MRQATRTPGKGSWVRARMSLNGQVGSISSGKRLASTLPSTCSTSTGAPLTPAERMQDDEAGAVGDEIAERLAVGGEGEVARSVGRDAGPVGEALLRRRGRPRRR